MSLDSVLTLSAGLFAIGLFGVLTKTNLIAVLMCVELMFNAINLAAVGISRYVAPSFFRVQNAQVDNEQIDLILSGHVLSIFSIAISAAEVSMALAIIILIYRTKNTVDISDISKMSG
jgi:NADH:ubiquinone oxidoreductase subunit K|tara:strand:+ start:1118 stop:1471 length:354 start_codon:yes stop_codon:yes gene_type:complete